MKKMLQNTGRFLARLHRNEQGGDMLEKILIIAAIVLPLLGVLFLMRDWISEWLSSAAEDVADDADFNPTPPPAI